MNYSCITYYGYLDSPTFLLQALPISTVISTPIHIVGMFCLLVKTPEQMRSIKWYLVVVQIWIILFDYSLSILFVPYILFPALAGTSLGVSNSFNVPVEFQGLEVLIALGCKFRNLKLF